MSKGTPYPIYIGKWPDCGCVTAACVDVPEHAKDTAKFIAGLIRSGQIVERVPDEEFTKKVKLRRCPHHSPKPGRLK